MDGKRSYAELFELRATITRLAELPFLCMTEMQSMKYSIVSRVATLCRGLSYYRQQGCRVCAVCQLYFNFCRVPSAFTVPFNVSVHVSVA